MDGNLIQQV
jgi:hypothetical protein